MLVLRMLAAANRIKKMHRRLHPADRRKVGALKMPLPENRRPHESLPIVRKIARLGTAAGLKSMIDRKLVEHVKRLPPGITRSTMLRSIGAAKTVNQLRGIVNHPIQCIGRKVRRNVLFANKIAGRNRRRSPGTGGTYRRTEQSKVGC